MMNSERNLPALNGIVADAFAERPTLSELSLLELSLACAVHTEFIVGLVDEGVLQPRGQDPHVWRFSGLHMQRTRVAWRLQRDLGVNLAGAALALQLLDEVKALEAQLRIRGR
jgi:chaperone modulatory protein CbpM